MTTVIHRVAPTHLGTVGPLQLAQMSHVVAPTCCLLSRTCGWSGKGVHGSCPAARPASHPSSVSPGGVGVQVEHGLAPAVNSQRDTEDPNNVHHYSSPGLRGKKRWSVSWPETESYRCMFNRCSPCQRPSGIRRRRLWHWGAWQQAA